MLLGGVAPSAVGARGAEVGGRHDHGAASDAVLGSAGVAHELEAGAAREARVEERGAQGRRVGSIAGAVQVAEPTCPTCTCGITLQQHQHLG